MCRHVGCVGIYKEFSWRSLLWGDMGSSLHCLHTYITMNG